MSFLQCRPVRKYKDDLVPHIAGAAIIFNPSGWHTTHKIQTSKLKHKMYHWILFTLTLSLCSSVSTRPCIYTKCIYALKCSNQYNLFKLILWSHFVHLISFSLNALSHLDSIKGLKTCCPEQAVCRKVNPLQIYIA